MARLEFGLMVQPKPLNFSGRELFNYNKQLIEALSGFSSLWVEDHLQWGDDATLECLTSLSYFGGQYPDYRLGTLVLGQFYRNPALLAKMAANIQFISGGRLVLGVGAGWKEDEYLAYGYGDELPNTKARLDQLEETVQILRALWSKQPASFEGKYYHIREAYSSPQPEPAIPLLIGGGGEKRTLEIVARYADWYNFNSCPVEEYAHKIEVLGQHCQKIGRDPSEIRLTYLATVSISENPAEVQRSPDKHFVAGSAAEIIRELEQFQALGLKEFIVRVPDLATLERFVKTVVPHFA
jgi:alkanesulfonate monooxygenase SsuD/methylene tetrahydromethanopterin reductase-like flavin-dependent oxidoreductase (luciferase family)